MDGNFWAVVGAVAAVIGLIGIVVGILTFRRQFPRRQLQYEIEAIPLLHDDASALGRTLRVTLNGMEIADPHVINVRIWSRSRADISSEAFDNREPIRFVSSRPMHVTGMTMRAGGIIGFDWEQDLSDPVDEVRIPPQLIRRRSIGGFAAVTAGRPEVEEADSLVDIKVNLVADIPAPLSGTKWAFWFAASTTVAALASALSYLASKG